MKGLLKILIAALFVVSPAALPHLAFATGDENSQEAATSNDTDQAEASDEDSGDQGQDKDKEKKKKKKKKDKPKCIPTGSRLNRC